jgi:hypothetical protein
MEQFKDIPGFEGLYAASNWGRIKNLKTDKIKKPSIDKGYNKISLSKGKVIKMYRVARLVALTWVSNPLNKPEVNHIDGNKRNDVQSNLEWVTSSENSQHAHKSGLQVSRIKPILQLNSEGKLIKEWKSPREASTTLGISNKNISQVARGIRGIAGGFKWRYKDEPLSQSLTEEQVLALLKDWGLQVLVDPLTDLNQWFKDYGKLQEKERAI